MLFDYESILYPGTDENLKEAVVSSSYLHDMQLDDILNAMARLCVNPAPLYRPICDASIVQYRQEVFRDLEVPSIRRKFSRFGKQIRGLQKYEVPSGSRELTLTDCSRLFSVADQYTSALSEFLNQFPYSSIHSVGLRSFLHFCRQCHTNPLVVRMRMDIVSLKRELHEVSFLLILGQDFIGVSKQTSGTSIDQRMSALFSRFGESYISGATCLAPSGNTDLHIENEILNLLATHYPGVFEKLVRFCSDYQNYIDPRLLRFADEIEIYSAYLDYTDRIQKSNLPFCYPEVSEVTDGCYASGAFDLVLAESLREQEQVPIQNDFSFNKVERILVVTGPNQGGKTTFARMVGQVHYLASLGFPIPCSSARLMLPSGYFSHFGDIAGSESGALKSDLIRLKEITDQIDSKSLVIINEIFASATMSDGLALGQRMMKELSKIGCFGVCVTFLEELASQSPNVVSMVGIVPKGDPGARTFLIRRKPPQGQAYAEFLAEANGLRYDQIIRRIQA